MAGSEPADIAESATNEGRLYAGFRFFECTRIAHDALETRMDVG